MAVRQVDSAAHRAVVAELEAGLGPFDDPAWRADLASLHASVRAAAVQWAVDALTVHSLAQRVPRSPGDERGGTPWTSFLREVAVARRCSDVAAHGEVALSTSLVTRHPLTLGALAAGDAPALRAKALVRACLQLPDDVVVAVESALAHRLDHLTPGRIEAEVQRIALRLQPELGAQQEAGATADRTASRRTLAHGQSEIVLTGPAAANQRWWEALTERARALKAAGDPRTLGALRYDVAVSLDPRHGPGTDPLLEAVGAGRPAADDDSPAAPTDQASASPFGFAPPLTDDRRCTRPVQVLVQVAVSTALGLDDEPGWLDGHGWVSAPLSRRLLSVAELRKACVHPRTGQLVDLAERVVRPPRTPASLREALHDLVLTPHDVRPVVVEAQAQHDPSPALEAFVQARDRWCDGPVGTAVPATRTDTDHHVPWPDGPTAAWNLHCRSARTHHLRHLGWRADRTAEGTWWTSPAGQTARNPRRHDPPPDVAPGARPPDPEGLDERDRAWTRPPPRSDPPEDRCKDEVRTEDRQDDVARAAHGDHTGVPAVAARTLSGWPEAPPF